MLLNDLPKETTTWAVADLGDVIYMATNEEINSEFPTQHHVACVRSHHASGTCLFLANDNVSITARFYGVQNVDLRIIAFTEMLVAVENMVKGD